MTYRGEMCEECGFPVAHFVRTFWHAANELWNEVVGTPDNPRGEGIILCPPCFALAARAKGICVSWVAEVYSRKP